MLQMSIFRGWRVILFFFVLFCTKTGYGASDKDELRFQRTHVDAMMHYMHNQPKHKKNLIEIGLKGKKPTNSNDTSAIFQHSGDIRAELMSSSPKLHEKPKNRKKSLFSFNSVESSKEQRGFLRGTVGSQDSLISPTLQPKPTITTTVDPINKGNEVSLPINQEPDKSNPMSPPASMSSSEKKNERVENDLNLRVTARKIRYNSSMQPRPEFTTSPTAQLETVNSTQNMDSSVGVGRIAYKVFSFTYKELIVAKKAQKQAALRKIYSYSTNR